MIGNSTAAGRLTAGMIGALTSIGLVCSAAQAAYAASPNPAAASIQGSRPAAVLGAGITPDPSTLDHPRGIVPRVSQGQPRGAKAPLGSASTNPNCPSCSPPLVFHRGIPVMGGLSGSPGHVTITPVYWAASGYSYTTNYKTIINGYIQNVALASQQSTNVFSVSTQYYQQSTASGAPIQRIQYAVQAGAEVDDPMSYPHGCSIAGGYSACVTDAQLQTELQSRLTALSLPMDDSHAYMVLFPSAVETCFNSVQCSSNTYCAYHSYKAVGSSYMIYGDQPFPVLNGCADPWNGPQAPNGDTYADSEISTLSHEVNESITDWAGAWYDPSGFEDGDECAYVYGAPLGSTGGTNTFYNQVVGNGKYYTQGEFSNEDYALGIGDSNTTGGTKVAGCVQRDELPTASFTGPASAAAGTSASFNGSSSSDPDNTTPLTYSWNWGDGTANGTGATATHSFLAPGTVTVTLRVTDVDGWSASNSHVVTVTGITRGIFRFTSTDFATMHTTGFNAATDGGVQVYGSAEAAAGIAGMVWVDAYNNTTCLQTMTDAAITSMVQANVNAGLRGLRYEIGDEPMSHGCTAAPTYIHITQLVHAADSTAKTWVVDGQFQVGDPVLQGVPMKGSVDILAFDVYPCQSGPCQYSAIDSAVQQIHVANVTNWEFVIQDFSYLSWRWPTPTEIQAQFDHWRGNGASGYWVFAWDYQGQQVTGQAGNVAALQSINSQDPTRALITYGQSPQGNWVSSFGADGYDLPGWTGSSDLAAMPKATVIVDQAGRWLWTQPIEGGTTAIQALESPDAASRRAACFYDAVQLRLHLNFPAAYSGNLHLFAVDWDSTARRETVTVNDGSGPQTADINTDFSKGAWINSPINVPAGGTVTISAIPTAGVNAVLSGIFLGDLPPAPAAPTGLIATAYSSTQINLSWNPSTAPTTYYKVQRSPDGTTAWTQIGTSLTASFGDTGRSPSTTYFYRVIASNGGGDSGPSTVAAATTRAAVSYSQAPQGNWVGVYGADGYDLFAWNGSSDLVSMPKASVVLDQGSRWIWTQPIESGTTAVQALESLDTNTRRAACFYDSTQLRLHLTFPAAYNGNIHIYVVDWDSTTRRETITIDDGSGSAPQTANISTDFSQGAWVNVPISVAANGSVTITLTRTAGVNAVLSGIFLG